eukprot:scaffold23466_cov98-Cylindrotheca_fusiformis.AAC.1
MPPYGLQLSQESCQSSKLLADRIRARETVWSKDHSSTVSQLTTVETLRHRGPTQLGSLPSIRIACLRSRKFVAEPELPQQME